MTRAIIFDLGRVIVPFDFRRGYARLEPLCGIPAAEIPARISTTNLVQRFESGEIEPEDFIGRFSAQLGMTISHDDFREIWMSIFLPETLIPEEMLEEIAATHRLVLLSNTNRLHFDGILASYPLLRHFHHFVLSYEVGAMKPAALIYEKAIEAARCAPEECFFTDDIEAYVDAAKRMGIDAVQFQSAEQIRNELRLRGVLS